MKQLRGTGPRRARDRGDDGLGVIDLMVSVVGFLLLTAMGAASLTGLLGMTAMAACQSDGQTIQTALESFAAANGPSVTPTQQDLLPATPGGTSAPAGIIGGPYLSVWPSNPAHYTYSISGTGQEMITVSPLTTASAYVGSGSCATVH